MNVPRRPKPHTRSMPLTLILEQKTARRWVLGLISVFSLAIFGLDLFTPVGINFAMLYVAPIYLSSWVVEQRATVLLAIACSILTVTSFYLAPTGGIPWIVVTNHLLAIGAIWMTTGITWLHRRLTAEIQALRRLLPICDSCKQIQDERGCWSRLETYVAQYVQTDFAHGICPTCEFQYYQELVARRASG